MEWLKFLLRVASYALPAPYRRRWLEETLAVLYDVYGWRRWWYAVDTALKAPLLAREYQRASAVAPRRLTDLAGATLVATPCLIVGGIFFGGMVGLDLLRVHVIVLMLLAPLPAVAVRSFAIATRRGGGVRYAGAAALTVMVAVGPIGTFRAAVEEKGDWTVLGAALLGGWLVWVNAVIVRRRTGAADQAVLGVIAGAAITLLAAGSVVTDGMLWGFVIFGIVTTIPVLATWCVMAGLRLLFGRNDLMLGSDAGGADRGVEVGG
jgi:hypothetical protein